MLPRGWSWSAGWCLVPFWLVIGCESPPRDNGPTPAMSNHRAQVVAKARLARGDAPPTPLAEVPSRPVGPAETQPAAPQAIQPQVPDPLDEVRLVQADLARPDLTGEQRAEAQRLLGRLDSIRRQKVVRLDLRDAIRRAVRNSYAIQSASYAPAIEAARIVEAEAAFDAVFFTDFNYSTQDRPSGPNTATKSDSRTFDGGIRKLLSTGMQVQASYNMNRTKTNVSFQTPNPSYFNQFIVDFRQPLLRNFGVDFNLSQIELHRLDRAIAIERLRRGIRETIYNVEQAYWRLLQARRSVTVAARLLGNLETILRALQQRLEVGYDVYIVQVKLTESRVEQHRAEFVRLQNDVKNAEDALKRLINDPGLNQAEDIEIIPTDVPAMEPVVLDQLGELTAALGNRSELHEAKLAIEQAQLTIGVAKNQALPRLDLFFRYIIDGLGTNSGNAFNQLSRNDFNEYVLSVEFEWPIGARAGEAQIRRARLQQAQAIASHRDAIENVITEVNTAIRDLQTNYDQIGPSLRSAQASQEQVRATQIRTERLDPPTLQVLLNAHEALATARQQLLQVLADYNIALINLERQKGTLLQYNNIMIRGCDEEGYLEAYRPIGP